jgi:Flp pilus assembly protein TadD
MLEGQITDLIQSLQPYAAVVSAIFSVAALGLLVNILRLAREAAAERIKVFEDRLAGAKEERERDKTERERDEKWHARDKERLERELSERQRQIESLLAGAGLDLTTLAVGDGLRTLTHEVKSQLATLTEELKVRLAALPAVSDQAGAGAQLTLAKGKMAIGQWGGAAALFDEYTKHDLETDWEAQFSRGVAHANSREGFASDLAALRSYNEAIALAPDDLGQDYRARLHAYRGAILKRLSRLDEAEADLRIAQKLASADYEVIDTRYNLACIFAMRGERQAMIEAVLALGNDPSYMAAIRSHLGDYFVRFRDDVELRSLVSA